MQNQETIIAEIGHKIERLGEEKRSLSERLGKSQTEIEQLKERIVSMDSELGKIKEENHLLTMAKSLDATEQSGSAEARKRINELVKEIDKCIALLNK